MKGKSKNEKSYASGSSAKEILERRAEQLACESRKEGAEDEKGVPMMLLGIGDETFGVELTSIWEVIAPSGITPVPGAPGILRGVVNFRGEVVPLYDITAIITGKAQERNSAGGLVVFGKTGVEFAVAVDKVEPPERINLSELNEPFGGAGDAGRSFIRGITGNGVVVLNVDAMFDDDALRIKLGS